MKKDFHYIQHHKASKDYNLAVLYPEVLPYYDHDKNTMLPSQLTPQSSKIIWWKCDHGHQWQKSVAQQVLCKGCAYCNHEKASDEYNLKTLYPQIAKEWDYEKNAMLPEEMLPYSGKRVSWVCSFNPTHTWDAVIIDRTRKFQGCRICGAERKTSFPEQAIYYYIKKLLKDKECFNRWQMDGWELDVYVPQLSFGIEYNGIYHELYHREAYDEKKKQYMKDRGIQLLVIKENQKCIEMKRESDVIICRAEPSYRYMNEVLQEIMHYLQEVYAISYDGDIDMKRDAPYIRALFIKGKKENSLAYKYPELAKQWHKEANYPITAEMVAFGSGAIYSWQCEKGHVWKATPNKRTNRKDQCPFCSGHRVSNENRLSKVKPMVAKMWDYDNNELTPSDVSYGSHKMVHWKCDQGHTWTRSVKEMVKSGQCPYCDGKRFTIEKSLAVKAPELLSEWDYEKNGISPWEISYASKEYAYWKCAEGHSWNARISNRTYLRRGCPYCHHRLPTKTMNLAIVYPQLAAQWNYEKNEWKPEEYRPKSNKRVWWKCEQGHVWEESINNRVAGSNCPQCRSHYVRGENLVQAYPLVANRWHYEKNHDKSPQYYSAHSREKVWWKCEQYPHHEWQRRIYQEIESKGCPYCTNQKVCKENSLASLYPQFINEWDYDKNGSLQPHDVLYKSAKMVSWICENGHHYDARIKERSLGRKGCPYCK